MKITEEEKNLNDHIGQNKFINTKLVKALNQKNRAKPVLLDKANSVERTEIKHLYLVIAELCH